MSIPKLALLFIVFSGELFAQKYICGETKVSINKTGTYENTRVHVTVENINDDASMWLHSVDYVNGICLTNTANKNKILINAHCGGSGCSDSNYIIIDAETLMVELVPVQGKDNLAIAENLLGKKITE